MADQAVVVVEGAVDDGENAPSHEENVVSRGDKKSATTTTSSSSIDRSTDYDNNSDDAASQEDTHTDLLEFPQHIPTTFRRKASQRTKQALQHSKQPLQRASSARQMRSRPLLSGTHSSDQIHSLLQGSTRPAPPMMHNRRVARINSGRRAARPRAPGRSVSTDAGIHNIRLASASSGGMGPTSSAAAAMQVVTGANLMSFGSPAKAGKKSAARGAQSGSSGAGSNKKAPVGGVIIRGELPDMSFARGVPRNRSGDDSLYSMGSCSIASDLDSCFTTDSISLRKSQLVADPVMDGASYHTEMESFAEHDSVFDSFSVRSKESSGVITENNLHHLHQPQLPALQQPRIGSGHGGGGGGNACDVSFYSGASYSTLGSACELLDDDDDDDDEDEDPETTEERDDTTTEPHETEHTETEHFGIEGEESESAVPEADEDETE